MQRTAKGKARQEQVVPQAEVEVAGEAEGTGEATFKHGVLVYRSQSSKLSGAAARPVEGQQG